MKYILLDTASGAQQETTTTQTGATTGAPPGEGQPPPNPCGSMGGMLPMFAIMFIIFYFLLIRPQKKRDQKQRDMLSAVKKNDKVVTIGGIHGTVDRIKTDEGKVVIKVDDNTKLTFSIRSIQTIVRKDSEEDKK
jgi:preprotein translocase subunit YajC